MKLFRKGELVREIPVNGYICGTRIDEVRLTPKDLYDLYRLPPEMIYEWVEKLIVRVPPNEVILDGD